MISSSIDCSSPLHPLALRGIALFNRGNYFEAHEELELAWRAESGQIRDLYRVILQIAVGYYHLTRRNYRGARKMFLRVRQWIHHFPPVCRTVDVASLCSDYQWVEAQIANLEQNAPLPFDLSMLPKVILHTQPQD